MKHKTWFRLVVKAIGLLLIGLSLPQFIGWTTTLVVEQLAIMPSVMGGMWYWSY